MITIIKNGHVINASDSFLADILIEDEKIKCIGSDIQVPDGCDVINAKGKFITPGGIDVHVHLDLPMFGTVSADDYYSGQKAAAFGGTTTVIDFVSHDDHRSLLKNIDQKHSIAGDKAVIDYSFHMNITHLDDQVEKEIPLIRKEGINSIKVFTAYNNRLRLGDGEIMKVMRIARENGILVMVHAENGDMIELLVEEALRAGYTSPIWHAYTRPVQGEVESVYRVISLSAYSKTPIYIVHMNTKGGVDHVRNARTDGLPVMGETCPQYLFFNSDHLLRPDGAKWICSPPMRTPDDNAGVWKAVQDGTMQVIATDHCPFFFDGTVPIYYEGEPIKIPGKELGKNDFTKIPNGLPGVGDRLMVMWTKGVGEKRITPNQFVDLMSTNPAKIFGLYPMKGAIMPGSDADLVIWDPEKEITYGLKYAHHRNDYNLYEGMHLKGGIEKVFLRGKLIVDHEHWLGVKGSGKFLKRGEISII